MIGYRRPVRAGLPGPDDQCTGFRAPGARGGWRGLGGGKVLDANGLRYAVTTVGGADEGPVTVNFPGNAKETFPPIHLTGATEDAAWRAVPEADTGARAQPTTCTATAG